jgi:AcrR family transcriptional regulator
MHQVFRVRFLLWRLAVGMSKSYKGKARSPNRDRSESASSHGGASGVLTRRDRERLRCRGDIMAAALKLFAQHGIEKSSMKQIAEEADMSVGKLYAYFRGKEEIVRELLHDHFREFNRRGDDACRPADAPLEQLRCRLEAAVAHFREHIDFLMIYHNESPMSFEGIIREEIERNIETAAKLLAQAMDSGDIPPEDPVVLAAVIIGSVHELLHSIAERGDREAFEGIPAIIDRIILKPLEIRQEKDAGMEGR